MDKKNLQERLKGLSLEQKQDLLKNLRQKEVIKKENVLKNFEPHAGQLPYLFSTHKLTAVFCGNGWGKTTILTLRLILAHYPELWDELKQHFPKDFNPPTDPIGHDWFLITGFDKVEDYWTELQKLCPPSRLPKPNKMGTSAIKRLEWDNNTFTTFYSHDQDPKKAESTNIGALLCDEPPPRDLWIAAYRGLRGSDQYFVLIAGTPISEPWIYTEIYQPWAMKKEKNTLIIQGSTFDNPHLSKAWIKDFESKLTDDERRTRLHGEFSHLQGRVFKEFTRATHVFSYQKWPTEWPVYMSIDPHPRKPHTALWLGVTDEDILVVIDELSIEGDIETFAEAVKEKEKTAGYKIVSRRIDNSGVGTDWNRDSFIAQLSKFGIRTSPMRKSEKDVASSIQKMKLLLKNKGLLFLENCVHTISDMELFAWQDYRNPAQAGVNEKPRKIHDDFIDNIRYIVVSNPVHSPSLEVISTLSDRNPYNKDSPSLRQRNGTLEED